MKKLILGTVLLSTLSFGSQFGNGFNSSSNDSSSGYKGSSGRTYQYDMSNQNDRLRYSTDTGAKKRDMSAGGYVDKMRDQHKGQYGGGIYDR